MYELDGRRLGVSVVSRGAWAVARDAADCGHGGGAEDRDGGGYDRVNGRGERGAAGEVEEW